jgi:hypothetical protein
MRVARRVERVESVETEHGDASRMANEPRTTELNLDLAGMFLEETFTDRRVGTLRRLTPVKSGGSPDAARKTIYVGETQVMTPMGALPIAFEIDAASLDEAAGKFGSLAKVAIERTVRELQELRREAASQIVVPQGGLPPGGLGGLGGGGKIQMP